MKMDLPDHMVPLGRTGIYTSPLGLGCSLIASLSTRPNQSEIIDLLDAAWDNGVRFFDTANIYGQGDSERRLARLASRDGAVICTKAGLALTASQTLVRLVKPVLRPMLVRRQKASAMATAARIATEMHDLRPGLLERHVRRSLKRLQRDRVDVFLLHSPPLDRLKNQVLFEFLDYLRDAKLARAVGVSCQSLSDAEWILSKGRVDVLQIPLTARDLSRANGLLNRAADAGVGIIAREVLQGQRPEVALPPLIADPRVAVTLTGTTNREHLLKNIRVTGRAL